MYNFTYAYPLNTYFAAYCDPRKSLPHKTEAGLIENPRGLAFWTPEQRYIANIEDYLDLISQLDLVEHEIKDPESQMVLIKFFVEKGKSGVWNGKIGNGMIAMQYTEHLMAYRKRDDGLLGLESNSGLLDTRLSKSEKLKKPNVFPSIVPTTNTLEANFKGNKSVFIKKISKE